LDAFSVKIHQLSPSSFLEVSKFIWIMKTFCRNLSIDAFARFNAGYRPRHHPGRRRAISTKLSMHAAPSTPDAKTPEKGLRESRSLPVARPILLMTGVRTGSTLRSTCLKFLATLSRNSLLHKFGWAPTEIVHFNVNWAAQEVPFPMFDIKLRDGQSADDFMVEIEKRVTLMIGEYTMNEYNAYKFLVKHKRRINCVFTEFCGDKSFNSQRPGHKLKVPAVAVASCSAAPISAPRRRSSK
jgi:hypothetical protein